MENNRPPSILLVDDEASNLHILNQILKDDYSMFAARTGRAALKIALEKAPNLILLDVILPDINGYQVLTELKSVAKTSAIPVIIISGLNNQENEQKGLQLGAAGYISKPFSTATVKEQVQKCLPASL